MEGTVNIAGPRWGHIAQMVFFNGRLFMAGKIPADAAKSRSAGFIDISGENTTLAPLGPLGFDGKHICIVSIPEFGGPMPILITDDDNIWAPRKDGGTEWEYRRIITNEVRTPKIAMIVPYPGGFILTTCNDLVGEGAMLFTAEGVAQNSEVIYGTGFLKKLGDETSFAATVYVDSKPENIYAIGEHWGVHLLRKNERIWKSLISCHHDSYMYASPHKGGVRPVVIGPLIALAGKFFPQEFPNLRNLTYLAFFHTDVNMVLPFEMGKMEAEGISALAAYPDKQRLYIGWKRRNSKSAPAGAMIDLETGEIRMDIFPSEFDINHLTCSPDGVFAAVTQQDPSWRIIFIPHP